MDHTECHLHHALNTSRRFIFNENVGKLLSFVCKRQNPYNLDEKPVPLHHLLSKQAVDRQVAERRLACLKKIGSLYTKSIDKKCSWKKNLNNTISRRKLPLFNEQSQQSPATIKKENKSPSHKDFALAQRNMTVAMERCVELGRILEYDLLQITPLFDDDLPSQVNKSTLVVAIEPKVDLEK